MRCLPLLATAFVASLAVAPGDARRDRKAEAAMFTPIPGAKAENCVQIVQIRETRVRDDSTIDFYMRDGRIYRNTLPNSCPQLGFEESFSYATSLSQLCSVDIITVLNRTGGGLMRGASCGLGSFVPVAKAK
ncbi:hypothetical protein [Sphingomonas profundi]|uniref:hypothetical protein n=1 Tax=Alterirhizorhabdus profundi TaxID=2681549 RepID=UPI001E55FDA2|nr:hypothetical protein [Sphingomonas profundi]